MILIEHNIKYWKSFDGRVIPLPFLSDEHLENSIRVIKRKYEDSQKRLESISLYWSMDGEMRKREETKNLELETSLLHLHSERLARRRDRRVVEENDNIFYDISLQAARWEPGNAYTYISKAVEMIQKDNRRGNQKAVLILYTYFVLFMDPRS